MSTEEGSLAAGAATHPSRTAGRLEEKGRELGRKADELGARLQGEIRNKTQELQEAGHRLQERLAGAKERVAHRVHDGRVQVERQVQEHPVRSLLYAFGAGAIVGLLLGRRLRR
jgi:ElaB/YqjD/DUF883 family membrane-anchored ribosome-binding protein